MISLNELTEECFCIAVRREQDMTATGTVKHLAGEVVELQESLSQHNKGVIGAEIADCIICCLTLSEKYDIDIEKCLLDKIKYNASRA